MVDGVLKAIVSHGSKDYRIFKPSSSLSIVAEPDEYDVSNCFATIRIFHSPILVPWILLLILMEQKCLYQDPIMETVLFLEYHLSTGFDISTASYDSNFSLTNIGAMDIAFNTDGTKMFVSGSYYGNGLIF